MYAGTDFVVEVHFIFNNTFNTLETQGLEDSLLMRFKKQFVSKKACCNGLTQFLSLNKCIGPTGTYTGRRYKYLSILSLLSKIFQDNRIT